jgi:cysteine desulfuration protein SufE
MAEPQNFRDIEENFALLDDWEDRYRYIIELGQALPPLADAERSPEHKVSGCVSQAWLVSEPRQEAGRPVLRFRGESDALIVRGLVAILIALYSDRPAEEIATTDAIALFDRMGLREHLSTQRSNGLISMVDRMRGEARAAL